jgi:two-component system chemotaxis response regulator CheY
MIDINNKSIKILFVDDSKTTRRMLESFLFDMGYINIESAIDGVDALEKIEHSEEEFDFIITDINMPNMDGITLIHKLRMQLDYAATPIMVLSTEYSQEMKKKGKDAGATSWVVKPFDLKLIESAIRKTIQRVNEH